MTVTPIVGQVISVTFGAWNNGPTSFAYQWLSSAGGAIPGATGPSYIPVVGDIGNLLTASVVASNGSGNSAPVTSAPTNPVIPAIPVNTALPTIAGIAQVGQTLTASPGAWTNTPTTYTYQWSRAGTPIGGATSSTYVPVSADVGNTLTVSVIATNSGGSSFAATSVASATVIPAQAVPVNTALPTISGTAQVGQTLTATTGTWTNSPTSFTYQWNRSGLAIGGATASTYVPGVMDVGSMLTVSVTAINSGGSSLPATSAPTSNVAPATSNSTAYIVLLAA
jgi:hypothetical protein